MQSFGIDLGLRYSWYLSGSYYKDLTRVAFVLFPVSVGDNRWLDT